MRKIAIVGTNGLPGRYGGWDQLMEHLTKLLSTEFSFTVYCSSHNIQSKHKTYNHAKLVYLPIKANGWQSVIYDILSSFHAIFYSDTILLLGGAGTLMFPILRLFGKEVVYHPDGIEWKRQKWSFLVRYYLKFLEKIGIAWCNKIISDNIEIQKYIYSEYKKTSYLIEYGSNHVINKDLSMNNSELFNIKKGNYAFKVCRIEPENNIDLILKSFSTTEVKLIIVGNWNNSIYGRKLRQKYINQSNFHLLDPIYDQLRLDELRSNCGIYIHGHSVGGTNPSLVEAMYLGLNVLAFDVNFNRSTTDQKANYFKNSEELNVLIQKFAINQNVYNKIGEDLKQIAMSKYLWSKITEKYKLMLKDK